jgi:hypothetical protein
VRIPPVNQAHVITIDDGFHVKVDGQDLKRDLIRRTLLGLAIYATDSAAPVFHVNSREFLKKVEGPEVKWSKRWKARCDSLINCVLFCDGDIIDLDGPAKRLKDNTDEVSKHIRSKFWPSVRTLIDDYVAGLSSNKSRKEAVKKDAKKTLKKALVKQLNLLIRGQSIYEEHRFAAVILARETSELLNEKPTGRELIRLNRMLLRDVYPELPMNRPLFSWFSAKAVTDGEYDISGLRFGTNPGPERIAANLMENRFKTRTPRDGQVPSSL